MKYEILVKASVVELEIEVNQYIAKGWRPLGGVCFNGYFEPFGNGEGKTYSDVLQAMILEENTGPLTR